MNFPRRLLTRISTDQSRCRDHSVPRRLGGRALSATTPAWPIIIACSQGADTELTDTPRSSRSVTITWFPPSGAVRCWEDWDLIFRNNGPHWIASSITLDCYSQAQAVSDAATAVRLARNAEPAADGRVHPRRYGDVGKCPADSGDPRDRGHPGDSPAGGRYGTLTLKTVASPGPRPFGNIQLLRNHWSGPAQPRAYYWYLTFADDAAICDLATRAQQALAFPYYDPVLPHGLHMTIDRIAPEGGITAAQLNSVSATGRLACQAIPPFRIRLGELSGTRGAIGFTVTPVAPISRLRDTLRAATLSVCPDAAATREEMIPHVTIAYGNTDGVPAADAIAAVETLNASRPRAEATVRQAAVVLLERRQRSYTWKLLSLVPLTGTA
jgi:2'-5' RNA ligase superfamily